jgi:ubiquitin-protein ligase
VLGSKPGDARRVVAPSGAPHRHPTTEISARVDHGVDVREIELSLRARPHATPKVTATTRMDTNRLAKELREIQSDTKSGVTVEVLGDNLAHMQGTLKGASPSVHLPPFRPSRGTAVRIRARPRSDLSRAHIRPASRSHTKPSTVDLTSDPSNHSSTAGPEESPYEGGKFYVSHPPDRPSHQRAPSPRVPFLPLAPQ